MSNMTLFKGANLPSRLKNQELDETTKSLMGGGTGSTFKRISIKGNVFRMVAGGKEIATNEDRAMNVIIVASAPDNSRTYYEGQYKEGEAVRPACWSNDGNTTDKGVKDPHASPKVIHVLAVSRAVWLWSWKVILKEMYMVLPSQRLLSSVKPKKAKCHCKPTQRSSVSTTARLLLWLRKCALTLSRQHRS